jgi:RNA polymerase sigma factor (sigma-70 family)
MTSLAQPASRSRPRPTASDPAARIAALFDAHCGFVCRVLQHHGVHEAALDDAVQDVFVTAHRRWSSFEGRSSAQSWLYGISRRIAFRYRRSADARARRFVDAGPELPEALDEPFARAHAAHSLAALLHGLDADKRTVFVLAELEGMTAPEVAEALGIPLGTAYSRLRAAWQVLGQQAGREHQRLRRALPSMRTPDPSPERRRHMLGLVMGGLGLPPDGGGGGGTAVVTGWLSQAKWLVVGAALGAGLLGARAAVVASRHDDAAPSSEAGAVAPAKRSPAVELPGTAAVPPRAPLPGDPPAAAEPSRPAASSRAPLPAPAMPPPAAASARPPAPLPATAVPTASEADSLAAELALLQRARVAVREGRAADALALLEQHARQFPRGQLVDERRALEADAGRSDRPKAE